MESQLLSLVEYYLSVHLHENALFIAEQLFTFSPSEVSRHLLAICYANLGDKKAASLVLEPSRTPANLYLYAKFCLELNEPENAEEALLRVSKWTSSTPIHVIEAALRDNRSTVPNGAAGLYLLGRAAALTNRHERAIGFYHAAIRVDPFIWVAYSALCELNAAPDPSVIFSPTGRMDDVIEHPACKGNYTSLGIEEKSSLFAQDFPAGLTQIMPARPIVAPIPSSNHRTPNTRLQSLSPEAEAIVSNILGSSRSLFTNNNDSTFQNFNRRLFRTPTGYEYHTPSAIGGHPGGKKPGVSPASASTHSNLTMPQDGLSTAFPSAHHYTPVDVEQRKLSEPPRLDRGAKHRHSAFYTPPNASHVCSQCQSAEPSDRLECPYNVTYSDVAITGQFRPMDDRLPHNPIGPTVISRYSRGAVLFQHTHDDSRPLERDTDVEGDGTARSNLCSTRDTPALSSTLDFSSVSGTSTSGIMGTVSPASGTPQHPHSTPSSDLASAICPDSQRIQRLAPGSAGIIMSRRLQYTSPRVAVAQPRTRNQPSTDDHNTPSSAMKPKTFASTNILGSYPLDANTSATGNISEAVASETNTVVPGKRSPILKRIDSLMVSPYSQSGTPGAAHSPFVLEGDISHVSVNSSSSTIVPTTLTFTASAQGTPIQAPSATSRQQHHHSLSHSLQSIGHGLYGSATDSNAKVASEYISNEGLQAIREDSLGEAQAAEEERTEALGGYREQQNREQQHVMSSQDLLNAHSGIVTSEYNDVGRSMSVDNDSYGRSVQCPPAAYSRFPATTFTPSTNDTDNFTTHAGIMLPKDKQYSTPGSIPNFTAAPESSAVPNSTVARAAATATHLYTPNDTLGPMTHGSQSLSRGDPSTEIASSVEPNKTNNKGASSVYTTPLGVVSAEETSFVHPPPVPNKRKMDPLDGPGGALHTPAAIASGPVSTTSANAHYITPHPLPSGISANPRQRAIAKLSQAQNSMPPHFASASATSASGIGSNGAAEEPMGVDPYLLSNRKAKRIYAVSYNFQTLLVLFSQLGAIAYYLSQFDANNALNIIRSFPKQRRDSSWVLAAEGRALMEILEFSQAEKRFETLVRMYPWYTDGLEHYSTALWHLRASDKLQVLGKRLLQQNKHCATAWIVLGNAESSLGNHAKAIQHLRRASVLKERYALIQSLLGHEYLAAGDMDKARGAFTSALKLDPRQVSAWAGLGTCHFRADSPDAEIYYRIALTINPRSPVPYCYLGLALSTSGKYDEALTMFDIATQINPGNTQAAFQRSLLFAKLGRYEEARADLLVVYERCPYELGVLIQLGKIAKKLGYIEEAAKYLTYALENLELPPSEAWTNRRYYTMVSRIEIERNSIKALLSSLRDDSPGSIHAIDTGMGVDDNNYI